MFFNVLSLIDGISDFHLTLLLWGILIVVSIVVELITDELTIIWGTVGAIFALISAALKAPVWLQLIIFFVFTISFKEEGYINDYKVNSEENTQGSITLYLKYTDKKERVITGLKRISKPGLRVYANKDEVPKVLNGLGIAIISTSKGIMTDKQARKENIGGEVLAYIW